MEEKPKKKKFKIKDIPVVPEKTNEIIAIEKLLKENIAFCVGKDFITVEGRNHTFRYFCITDVWIMTGSLKTGNGIDSLINIILRR